MRSRGSARRQRHAIGVEVRAVFHPLRHFATSLRPASVGRGRRPGRGRSTSLAKPSAQAIRVVAMPPVARRPPVHGTGLRRQQPRMSIQHHGKGQDAPRLLGVGRPRRLRPQPRNTRILACNLDCRHAARSANHRRAASSHICGRLGIPRESSSRAAGMRRQPRRKHAKYLDTRSGRVRLAMIVDNTAASIEAFVRANVTRGATLLTGGHASYPGLTGYRHDPRVVGKMAGHIVLPWIHRVFPLMKRWGMGTYHGLRRKHVDAYLNEFVFRYNRRFYRHVSFETLLGLTTHRAPASYWDIVGRDNPRKGAQTIRRAPRRRKTAIGMRQDGAAPAPNTSKDRA